jgi:GNAT superfamily N-acetyltransferase
LITNLDCEQAQTAWFLTRAEALGGEAWLDGGLSWAREADQANLLFPAEISPAALERGLERIDRAPVIIGAWLSLDVDPAPLQYAGFERGWSPWWMTAKIATVGLADDPRIELVEDELTRARPPRVWHAAAYADPGRIYAGHSWSHLSGEVAGIFDMVVWPQFQRRGLGSGLLRAVCAAAGAAGAKDAVLNATPAGKQLYETCGFRQIGEGITWWRHP